MLSDAKRDEASEARRSKTKQDEARRNPFVARGTSLTKASEPDPCPRLVLPLATWSSEPRNLEHGNTWNKMESWILQESLRAGQVELRLSISNYLLYCSGVCLDLLWNFLEWLKNRSICVYIHIYIYTLCKHAADNGKIVARVTRALQHHRCRSNLHRCRLKQRR